jgi:hypothetical protein
VEAELVSKHPLTFNTVTQHDSPLSFPRMRGNQKGASPARGGIGGGMSDFAGLRSGGILDASRWHDRLIWRAERKRACVTHVS